MLSDEAIYGTDILAGFLGECTSKDPVVRAWWAERELNYKMRIAVMLDEDPDNWTVRRIREELWRIEKFMLLRTRSDARQCRTCALHDLLCDDAMRLNMNPQCENKK